MWLIKTNLSSGNGSRRNDTATVARLNTVCNHSSLYIPNGTVGGGRTPETKVGLDRREGFRTDKISETKKTHQIVHYHSLALRVGALRGRITYIIATLRATLIVVRIDLVRDS